MINKPESEVLYERIIHENEDKFFQVRLSINKFRGIEYLHLRRYYLDFFGEWKPSNEGISIELGLSNTTELFTGLVEILSLAESKDIIQEHFSDILSYLYQT